MSENKRIAVTIPTYNEKDTIVPIMEEIHKNLPQAEILVVDDNSPDGTSEVVRNFIRKHDFVELRLRKKKEGLGRAYVDGFSYLIEKGFGLIFQMDADFSHDPRYLPEMLEKIKDGADVVVGSRYVSGGGTENWSLLRRFISRGGSFYASTVLGLKVKDVTAGYKCWKADVLKDIIATELLLSGFGFQIEMAFRTKISGAVVRELPIVFPDREIGESKMSGSIFKEALFGVWKLRCEGKKILEK